MSASKRIAQSTSVLAVATAISRILGLVRDRLMAGLFGTMLESQAFVVAFRIPNLLRDLVAEGAVTSAFVPVMSWYRARGQTDEFWALSRALLSRLVVLLCAVGLIGALAAPQVVALVAPGFVHHPEKFALTVRLTRILFPFITLVGLWAYFMGLLNSLQHFAVPALGPAILNVAMIAACVWFVPVIHPGVLALTISVIIGGVVQLAVQVPVAMRLGFRWHWRWHHEGSSRILRLMGPRLVGSAVYQVNVLVDTALSSLQSIVGDGAPVALYFANRMVQLPLALFGTASAQASLPSLSEQAARQDLAGFRSTMVSVIRMVGFIMLPSSAGLIVLAVPLVQTLFEYGAFDHRSTLMTAQAIIYYALGLTAYAVSKILTGAFYALHDTWTPVRSAMLAVAINIALSVALMWPLKLGGLALAAAISNSLNAGQLLWRMQRRLGVELFRPLAAPLGGMAAASLVMGVVCWLFWRAVASRLSPWLGLPATILLSLICYVAACALLRVQELSTALRWLTSLTPRPSRATN